MRDNDTAEKPADGTPVMDYAFWDAPDASAKVIYSLQLFHEIDFVVNEGYRKIPHGGIEVGGLLFGKIDGATVRIEAFRPIDCEHSSGPSLNLSERDLGELENQIQAAGTDVDLKDFQAIGWFLAHTRGPLELTDTESRQFERFFPQPMQLTVLVKPERFQPTRFGFLVRKQDKAMARDATSMAVILPLPGRSHKPGQLIASIPAPVISAAKRSGTPPPEQDAAPAASPASSPGGNQGRRKQKREQPEGERSGEEVESATPALPAAPLGIWKIPPAVEEGPRAAEARQSEPEPDSIVDLRTPEDRAARRQLGRDRARVIEQAFAAAPPMRPAPLPALPVNAVLSPYTSAGYNQADFAQSGYPAGYGRMEDEPARRTILTPRTLTALSLSAVLGCLAGYLGYLQLPAPVIPLDVRSGNQTILVAWPQEQTRNAIYAAIRFNDGAPVPLSAEEKMAGQVALAATKDFKVEVIARNWIRDSRGIVRYMHSSTADLTPKR